MFTKRKFNKLFNKLSFSEHTYNKRCTYNLQVRNADIETFIHVGMPHNSNVSYKKCSKVSLIT